MFTMKKVLCAALVACAAATSAFAQKAVIEDNVLKYSGKRYFKASAEDVQIGSYGEKKSPLTQANYLEVQSHVAYDKLKVIEAGIIDIDFKQSKEVDVKAKLGGAAKHLGLESDVAYSKLQKGELKLVKFIVENESLRKTVNGLPGVLNNLDKYGNDARIAHQIFVVLEAETATKVTTSTSTTASGTADGVKLTVAAKTKNERDTTVTLSKGMTYAYLLVKIDWDKKAKDLRIEKFTDDQQSVN